MSVKGCLSEQCIMFDISMRVYDEVWAYVLQCMCGCQRMTLQR